jgi:hypothetical protein
MICNSRPDCPCRFCSQVRAEMKANPRPKKRVSREQQKQLVDDFIQHYIATHES